MPTVRQGHISTQKATMRCPIASHVLQASTYSTVVSATSIFTCIPCPSDSNSPAGSSAVTNCTCNVGYSGPDGDTCTACVAGKYKVSTGSAATGVGSMTCSCGRLCQPSTGTSSGTISVGTSEYVDNMNCHWLIVSKGSISLLFSSFDTEHCCDFVTINRCTTSSCSTVEQVVKLSGSGGVGSIYTSSTGYMQVLFKTDGSMRGSGFVATWSITYQDTCTDCGAGTYSTAVGSSVNSTCIACPSNSNSPAGSSVVTNCTCNVGYSGPDGDSCTECMSGQYKESTGSAVCTNCGAGTYSTTGGASASSTCIACPSNSNSPVESPALASCTCNAGYWGSDGGPCTACLAGTVKTSTGSANCTDCGSGTYSTATAATVCTRCGVGSYSAAVSASATSTCITCPSNSNSPAGSTVLTHCACNAGFTGPNGETCTACVAGKHKESAGSANCIACAAGKYSVIHGSLSVSTCLNCPPGTYLDTESNDALSDCIACAAGIDIFHRSKCHINFYMYPLSIRLQLACRVFSCDELHLQRRLFWARWRHVHSVRGRKVQGVDRIGRYRGWKHDVLLRPSMPTVNRHKFWYNLSRNVRVRG